MAEQWCTLANETEDQTPHLGDASAPFEAMRVDDLRGGGAVSGLSYLPAEGTTVTLIRRYDFAFASEQECAQARAGPSTAATLKPGTESAWWP